MQEWNTRARPEAPEDPINRWVAYSGGVGCAQMRWLAVQLQQARSAGQRAVVLTHCPLHPQAVAARASTLAWNYEEVLQMLQAHSDVVVATVAGAHVQIVLFVNSSACKAVRPASAVAALQFRVELLVWLLLRMHLPTV